jgi:nickel/cobalt transporter (NicO) family protein
MRKLAGGRAIPINWLFHYGLALLGVALWLGLPIVALAHPLGNFTINHYSRIDLTPNQARIFYVLDMAEIPTVQIIQQIDQDRDGQLSMTERASFVSGRIEELRRGLKLTVVRRPIELTTVSTPELDFPPGQGGLSTLRLSFWMTGTFSSDSTAPLEAEFINANDQGRLGWREIIVRGQDGITLIESTVSGEDRSDELRTYPEDMLSSPLNDTAAQFTFQRGGVATQPNQPIASSLGTAKNDGAFAALITVPQLTPAIMLVALVSALGLGALHALEPGHGKTAAAVYLVGSRATPWHAILLGLTVTGMHTSSVFLLGFIVLFASRYIVPEQLLPWLALASGLIVVVVGVQLFWRSLLSYRVSSSTNFGHNHRQLHTHAGHTQAHSHEHGHGADHHHHLPSTLSWRSVLAIGVSGGLLPCPAAIVVLLSAISLGRIGFGLLLIVAFSAGLALVLSTIGLSVLYGERWFRQQRVGSRLSPLGSFAARLIPHLPAVGGLLVIGAGLLLLYQALPVLRIWQL